MAAGSPNVRSTLGRNLCIWRVCLLKFFARKGGSAMAKIMHNLDKVLITVAYIVYIPMAGVLKVRWRV